MFSGSVLRNAHSCYSARWYLLVNSNVISAVHLLTFKRQNENKNFKKITRKQKLKKYTWKTLDLEDAHLSEVMEKSDHIILCIYM